ncbi:MAG: hypothetical protein SFY81_00300 [Verrucomicrobiota bacterium]|nr:hypothetical protein [Verrucomicrobiota bacterium]
MQPINFEEVLEQIIIKDGRYQREAYYFLREALDHTQKMLAKASRTAELRHITGKELLNGVREYALNQYGPMALMVLNEWGIQKCEHIGDIVFNMVEHQLLSKTEQDNRADFEGGYDFEEAFRAPFLPSASRKPSGPEEVGRQA